MTKDELKELLDSGETYEAIGRMCGVTGAAIKKRAIGFGISIKRNVYNGHNHVKYRLHCHHCQEEIVKNKKPSRKYCSSQCQADHRYAQYCEEIEKTGKVAVKGYNQVTPTSKKYLIEKRGHVCSVCDHSQWNEKDIPLEVDHIDGDSENNKLENIRLICPNCHAQTDTYKSRNMGNGRHNRRQRYADGKSY